MGKTVEEEAKSLGAPVGSKEAKNVIDMVGIGGGGVGVALDESDILVHPLGGGALGRRNLTCVSRVEVMRERMSEMGC